jgi:hypothetical protein
MNQAEKEKDDDERNWEDGGQKGNGKVPMLN